MDSQALKVQNDLDMLLGELEPQFLMPVDMRGAVIVALYGEVAIWMQLCLFPFAGGELILRQRFERQFLPRLKALAARDAKTAMTPIIDSLHALGQCLVDLDNRGKSRAPIPKAQVAPQDFHRTFYIRLVLRMARPCRCDGGGKMGTERCDKHPRFVDNVGVDLHPLDGNAAKVLRT